MARSNPFAKAENKEKIKIESPDIVLTQEAADGLPVLEIPISNIEIPLKDQKGKYYTVVLDAVTKVVEKRLYYSTRKDKLFLTWFHDLFQISPQDAVVLVRIYLKLMDNVKSLKSKSFRVLANYLQKTGKRLASLTYKDFHEMSSEGLQRIANSGDRSQQLSTLKNIINHVPSLPNGIKNQINSYALPKNVGSGKLKTADERIQSSKINNDYSDYVMFQIYAYTNACLIEIKEMQDRLSAHLNNSELPEMFSKLGIEHYKKLVISDIKDDYLEALNMELVAHYKLHQANLSLDFEVKKGWNIEPVKEQLTQYKYHEAFELLPTSLKENKHVEYLFLSALKNGIAGDKMAIHRQIKILGSNRMFSVHEIISSRIYNKKKWLSFKRHIACQSILYQSFFGNRKDSVSAFTAPYHHIALGLSNHFDILLIILLLCETGRNKEVATNLPAFVNFGKDATSVLDIEAQFTSEPSCWLSSSKVRGHVNGGGKQEENMIVPINTPLFRYLKLFDSLRQQSLPDRELFFNVNKSYFEKNTSNLVIYCQIRQANGKQLSALFTKKFRKVWTGEVLIEYLDGIQDKDDLIKAVGEDLRNTIPLTYLLQSNKTETMLASAIVGLQMRFISHHLDLAVQIKLKGEKSTGNREKRFFCDCSDPYNPDYAPDLDLHVEYCRQFDMCLGCSKAVIYEEHLPNIIYRCFQFEDALKQNRDLYVSHYEIKHQRAMQVLERFKLKAENGHAKHAKAFKQASNAWEEPDKHILPPLIHPNINYSNVIPSVIQGSK